MKFPFSLRADKEFDAVGFGTNAVDYLIRVPHYPAFNSKVPLTEYSRAAGGEAASTMAGLQRLGMKTAYAGRFGTDAEGELGLRSLIAERVDVSFAETVSGAQTQIAFIVIDESSGERTIMWQRDKRLSCSARDAPVDLAGQGRTLHLTPHDTAAGIRMARRARSKGVIVSLDVDNPFDGIDVLLPLVDVCIASAEFGEKFLGLSDPRSALREIKSRFGCPVAGITFGAAGSLIFCNGSFIKTAGFEVPGGCVDTTGAGDAFRAGFLFGILSDETVEESALIANAVAALKCRGLGARDALPNEDELRVLLHSQASISRKF